MHKQKGKIYVIKKRYNYSCIFVNVLKNKPRVIKRWYSCTINSDIVNFYHKRGHSLVYLGDHNSFQYTHELK